MMVALIIIAQAELYENFCYIFKENSGVEWPKFEIITRVLNTGQLFPYTVSILGCYQCIECMVPIPNQKTNPGKCHPW